MLQNRALWIIFKLPARTNTDIHHGIGNIMLLENRRKLHSYQMAQWMASLQDHVGRHDLPTRSHAVGRRNLIIERPRNVKYLNSIAYQLPHLWNDPPTIAHCIHDTHEFKNKIKKHLNDL